MRAANYPEPTQQIKKNDPNTQVIAHVRILIVDPKETEAWAYKGGRVDGLIYPENEGYDVLMQKGNIDMASDPQVGSVVFKAKDWTTFCDKLQRFASNTILYGKGPESSTYFSFLRKLAHSTKFRNLELGCNKTSTVLEDPAVPLDKESHLVERVSHGLVPDLVDGYRPERKGPALTPQVITEFEEMKADLEKMETAPSFFNSFFQEGIDGYYKTLDALLDHQGGGLSNVFPRDVLQEGGMSQSAIINYHHSQLIEKLGGKIGFIGNETGGAKYDVACMDGFDPMKLIADELQTSVPIRSLTRSKWLNSLGSKSPEEQRFILGTITNKIRETIGAGKDDLIPWFPNNFHAGNHKEQDVTTQIMLEVGMTPVPNFVWSPAFTEDELRGWVHRQIELFQSQKRTLHEIRIKNPGQNPAWTKENVWKNMSVIREVFKSHGLEDPIIHIHNHDMSKNESGPKIQDSAIIARDLLKLAQKEGYRRTVIDTAPPETTHNNNLIVAEALTLTEEQHKAIEIYNQHSHTLFKLIKRFDVRETMRAIVPTDSIWAGGTGSSDLDSAEKIGMPTEKIEPQKQLASEIFPLFGIVTPFSEVLKRIGYALWQEGIETKEKAINYIEKGGTLTLSEETLDIIQEWKTLKSRPEIVEKFLKNHGRDLNTPLLEAKKKFDLESIRTDLKTKYPNISTITNELIAIYIGYGNSGERFLTAVNEGRERTTYLRQPEKLLQPQSLVKVGDTYEIDGEIITVSEFSRNEETSIDTYKLTFPNGKTQTFTRLNIAHAISTGLIKPPQKVKPTDVDQMGLPCEGELKEVLVKPGTKLTSKMVIAKMIVSKQELPVLVEDHHVGRIVDQVLLQPRPGVSFERSQLFLKLHTDE